MKWFKHISDSLDDPFIQDLIDEFGSDGYLVFFGMLEMMAREFKVETPAKVTLSRRFCRRKLRLSWQKISTILEFCEKEGRFFVKDNGHKLELNCPKLGLMCDDWTQRQLRSCSVVTPKKPRLEVEVEVEEEVDKEKKENTYSVQFDNFWKEYPNHRGGKKAAFKNWRRLKPKQDLVDIIMRSLEEHKEKSPDWSKGYVPYATTWLNQSRWTAEFEEDRESSSEPVMIEGKDGKPIPYDEYFNERRKP